MSPDDVPAAVNIAASANPGVHGASRRFDGAAMLATGVTPETYTIDNSIGHTVTIDATVMKGGDTATVTIVFDEAPVGLALDNLFLSGVADSAGLFSDLQADTSDADGLTYTATFTAPSDIDDPSAMIYVDGYGDAAGNQAGPTDNESFTRADHRDR